MNNQRIRRLTPYSQHGLKKRPRREYVERYVKYLKNANEEENLVTTISLCEKYSDISNNHYKNYNEALKEIKKLCANKPTFDLSSNSPKNVSMFFNLTYEYQTNAISALLFQALAVEAFINFYGSKRLGDKEFHDHYEKIGTIDKLIVLVKVATGSDFPKSENVYSKLKKLFKKRNDLVHYKSKNINLESSTDVEFNKFLENSLEFVFKDLNSIMSTYSDLKETIRIIENRDKDICKEVEDEIFEGINNNIMHMMNKLLG